MNPSANPGSTSIDPWLALAGIVALGVIIRLLAYAGLAGGDDSIYISSAVELSRGDYWPNKHWQVRLGVIGPTALMFQVFGYHPMIPAVVPFIAAVSCIVFAYWAAALFDLPPKVRLLAALFACVFPLNVLYSTVLYPSMPIAALTALALLLFVSATRRESLMLALAAGLTLGVAYTFRFTALYMLIPLLIHVIATRRISSLHLLVGVGLMIVIVIEGFAFSVLFDDWLLRWKVLTGTSELGATGNHFNAKANWVESRNYLRPGGAIGSPLVSLFSNQEYGLFFFAIIPATAVALFSGDRTIRPMAIVFLCLALYTLWGTTTPTAYLTLRAWPRYMSIAVIPGVIVLAWWLFARFGTVSRWSIILVLIASSLGAVYVDNTRTYTTLPDGFVAYAKSRPGKLTALEARDFPDTFIRNSFDDKGLALLVREKKQGLHTNPFKLNPSLAQLTAADLQDVDVVLSPNSKFDLPPNCNKTGVIIREQRWFSRLMEGQGGIFEKLTQALNPKQPHTIYECS